MAFVPHVLRSWGSSLIVLNDILGLSAKSLVVHVWRHLGCKFANVGRIATSSAWYSIKWNIQLVIEPTKFLARVCDSGRSSQSSNILFSDGNELILGWVGTKQIAKTNMKKNEKVLNVLQSARKKWLHYSTKGQSARWFQSFRQAQQSFCNPTVICNPSKNT